ncbi:respiratory chain complex I subunit 1 family protein [Leptospira idonii]|uniref:Formate hydrogenase n=1 Tax=Leptospira idonii TaxID=1193500 RepID=A0A4R9LWL7_9LEPT|nr:NADH-quinone oxidoreductase subunit H [Leptospira idonii]TGN17877.1 formate hydrogenase [Leptospira idonii]
MFSNPILLCIYQLFLFLVLPLILGGIVRKVRAWAQGRKGPKVLQVYYEIVKFLKKAPIDNPHSGIFSEISPMLAVYSSLILWSIVVFEWAPFILIPFFLALYRFAFVSFAMEGGTSFGGLGSGREILLSVMAEPTIILMILVAQSHIELSLTPVSALIGILFLAFSFIAILAELAKPPFDDPRTHLELTMVHEAMILEASGRTMGFLELASQIKLASLLAFLIKLALEHSQLFPPGDFGNITRELLVLPGVIFLSVFLGLWEANSVRRRWTWVPEFMGLAFLAILILGTLVKLS